MSNLTKETLVKSRRSINPTVKNSAILLQMSDEDLMAQFQMGTVDAFDILVSRLHGPLMNYLDKFFGDPMVSEDIIQETFLRAYRNRHSYCKIAKVSTWFHTIAGNLARSEYRKRKRQSLVSLESVNLNGDEYSIPIPDGTPLPDSDLESALLNKSIQEAFGQIPEDFRELVVLRDVQQLAYEEIADITGLPMGTVKSRIHRGRTKLQKILKEVYFA